MEDRENKPKWSPFAKTYDPLQSGSIDGTDTTPHDRALIRAMEAKYVPPNKNVATPEAEKTLFVGRLDHKTTEENLKREFLRYGTVTQCRVVKDVVTGFSRGYAFVQFKHHEDAERARQDAHRMALDGREILVEWENGRTMPGWIPRRLGGGFGGRKESGQLRFGGRHRPFRKPIVITPLRRDRPLNLDEEDVKPFQERDRQPAEEESERKSSRRENQRNDTKEQRNYSSSNSQFPRKNFSKPWNRRNPEYSCGRGKRSARDQRDWDEGEDRRLSAGRSSKDSNEWDSYKKGGRDRKWFSKSLRDRRDRNEREDPNEREGRRYSNKSSRDRGKFEERDDTHQRRPHKLEDNQAGEERSRRSQDREYPDEWEQSCEARSEKKDELSRTSRDREDPDEWDVSSERKVKKERSSNDPDMSDWENSLERSDKDKKRSISSKDREDDCEESPERSQEKKRSRRSRDRSDTEERDDEHEPKSKKKKKKSKKLSRDHEDSDDSYERKKGKKKKKKKKKSRD